MTRRADGTLHDVDTQQDVTLAALRAEVARGAKFRVHDQITDGDCTMEILTELVVSAHPYAAIATGTGTPLSTLNALIPATRRHDGSP